MAEGRIILTGRQTVERPAADAGVVAEVRSSRRARDRHETNGRVLIADNKTVQGRIAAASVVAASRRAVERIGADRRIVRPGRVGDHRILTDRHVIAAGRVGKQGVEADGHAERSGRVGPERPGPDGHVLETGRVRFQGVGPDADVVGRLVRGALTGRHREVAGPGPHEGVVANAAGRDEIVDEAVGPLHHDPGPGRRGDRQRNGAREARARNRRGPSNLSHINTYQLRAVAARCQIVYPHRRGRHDARRDLGQASQ